MQVTATAEGAQASPTAGKASLPPVVVAMAAQLLAWLLVHSFHPFVIAAAPLPYGLFVAQGLAAAAIGALFRLPPWWLPINLAFAPGAVWLQDASIRPVWYLAGFAALTLVFWTPYRTRVPLFLSSAEACRALLELMPERTDGKVLDAGCGIGTVLQQLAPQRPATRFTGVELAPVPVLIAWLRTRVLPNVEVRRGDLWDEDLARYDVVYAFLSPAAMPKLWAKVVREMRPGTLFVSNSFPVKGVEPDATIVLSGRGSRALHLWRM